MTDRKIEQNPADTAKATDIDEQALDGVQGGMGNFEIQDLVKKPAGKNLGNFEIQDLVKKPAGKNLGNFDIQD